MALRRRTNAAMRWAAQRTRSPLDVVHVEAKRNSAPQHKATAPMTSGFPLATTLANPHPSTLPRSPCDAIGRARARAHVESVSAGAS